MSLPLLLLPGMMCDARLFAPQIAALSGRSAVSVPALTGADTVAGLAAGILRGAPERFALGGLSMGGIVAMEMVRQAPQRIAGLALMDTNPLAEAAPVAARRAPQVAAARQGRLAGVMRDEMKPNYLAAGPRRAAVLDLCMEMALALGPDVFAAQSRALQHRPDQSETLRRYPGPALVLCGAEDRLCPVSRHELMAGLLPDAELRIIHGAGHLPTLERPGEVSDALADWLARVEAAPRAA